MDSNVWYTRDDVLNDLAQYTGYRMNDLNEQFVVRGSEPPPPLIESIDDDEFRLRFGKYGGHVASNDDTGPDLDGIQAMLRLVNENNTDDDKISEPMNQPTLGQKQCIVISKLDPNVAAFVPRHNDEGNPAKLGNSNTSKTFNDRTSKIDNSSPAKMDNTNKSKIFNSSSSNVDESSSTKIANDNISNIENKIANDNTSKIENNCPKMSSKKEHSTEESDDNTIEEIANALKNKIVQGAKENTLQHKKDRNVAIATLMKLHTTGDVSRPISETKSPKSETPPGEPSNIPCSTKPILFTPDYFAGHTGSLKVINVKDGKQEIPECAPLEESNIKTPSPHKLLDPHMKDSIQKVNNWLNTDPAKPKPKVEGPHAGPIKFQKKEVGSTKSSSTDPKPDTKELEGRRPPSFVRSKYADELVKQYEERIKSKEVKQAVPLADDNIWSKLERDLKARDEVIRKRWREQNQ